MSNNGSSPLVLWYNQLGMNDVDRVGGKNASLGEMITNLSGMGVSVPNGFATTADAFNQFLDQSGVNQRIYELLEILTMLPSLRKRARKSASGLSTLPSSLSWKTPSAKPMDSFPPMTKTLRLRCVPPLLQKICRTLLLPVSRKLSSTFRVLTPFSWQ